MYSGSFWLLACLFSVVTLSPRSTVGGEYLIDSIFQINDHAGYKQSRVEGSMVYYRLHASF